MILLFAAGVYLPSQRLPNFVLAARSSISAAWLGDKRWWLHRRPCRGRRHCSIRIRHQLLIGTFLLYSCSFASNLDDGHQSVVELMGFDL